MSDDRPDVEFSGIDPAPNTAPATDNRRLIAIESVTALDGTGAVDGGIAEQARRAFANMDRRLADAGVGRDDLTKITYYVADRDGLPVVAEIRDAYVGDRDIDVTFAAVSALAKPGALIEIDAFAVLTEGTR